MTFYLKGTGVFLGKISVDIHGKISGEVLFGGDTKVWGEVLFWG